MAMVSDLSWRLFLIPSLVPASRPAIVESGKVVDRRVQVQPSLLVLARYAPKAVFLWRRRIIVLTQTANPLLLTLSLHTFTPRKTNTGEAGPHSPSQPPLSSTASRTRLPLSGKQRDSVHRWIFDPIDLPQAQLTWQFALEGILADSN